ncbi:FAD-dependent oxidoreductase [Deinococcus sonorensis]|uniref:FAD-dependent oxidoreductase n=2 Tax=Deinococcus sonorensis TaxID=309891 RepID=A0AAU7U9J1_9DEIO
MRIVVVGGVAAGMSAASRAKRHDPSSEVVVFERTEWISYGACGLPYVLGGQVDDFAALEARTPAQMRARGIGVRLRHEVMGVDPVARTLTVRDLASGRTGQEPYDQLLLATGVSPVRPPWANMDAAGVHVLREIPDGQAIEATLQGGARRAAIIGGGYIGLEMAEALRARGLSVVLLEQLPDLAGRMLDPEARQQIRAEVERQGVDVRTGVTVEGLTARAGRVTGVQTDAGLVRADLVLVAVGVRPNVALAKMAGVRLGRSGAIHTDARQRTTVDGVWAAGDNTESVHRVSRRRVHVPLGLAANRMGRVAGINMAGGDARFPGIVGTAIFKVFDLSVARTGLSAEDTAALGLDAVQVDVSSSDHAGYYRDACPIQVRLRAERGTGRLLGAQLLGHGDAVKRVDVVATLLHGRGRVQDLAELDLAYAPPFSTVWDVLLVAAGRLTALI